MVNQSYPSLANAESMSELPSVLPVFVEGWRRLVESDTVRTTDTLQHEKWISDDKICISNVGYSSLNPNFGVVCRIADILTFCLWRI